MLRHVDLCSGIGGFSLGFEWAGLSQPILFCDINSWCRDILNKHWPNVPITEDVKELADDPAAVPDCDILTAGYPCQPFSVAGDRQGEEDDRHIWPHIRKIVAYKRPTWVVFENVYGHVSMGIDKVLTDLETDGYTTRTFVVPACGVNAPHRRDRVWIVGYTEHARPSATEVTRGAEETSDRGEEGQDTPGQSQRTGEPGNDGSLETSARTGDVGNPSGGRQRGFNGGRHGQKSSDGCSDVPDTSRARCEEQWWGEPTQTQYEAAQRGDWWLSEPPLGRVAYGIPNRVDKLTGLGNAIVPQIAMQIGLTIKRLTEIEDKDDV